MCINFCLLARINLRTFIGTFIGTLELFNSSTENHGRRLEVGEVGGDHLTNKKKLKYQVLN